MVGVGLVVGGLPVGLPFVVKNTFLAPTLTHLTRMGAV